MTETKRRQRNAEKQAELYPTFRVRIGSVITALEDQGIRPRIQEAYRSPADQLTAWRSGHSKLKFGFHNVTGAAGAKEALAVDLLDDDQPTNPSVGYLLRLAAAAEANGLVTGIRWGLPPSLSAAIDGALASSSFGAPVKVGWDPTHIQPTGITVTEARGGKRPL
ncbi:MAG: hypothetical protein HOP28_15885 [Gemmatimonadales bacterium]|nr:hypothetical protein [Gemmatimonadales bacterium]